MRKLAITTSALLILSGCDFVKKTQKKMAVMGHYQEVALDLAKENRILKAEINSLKAQLQKIKSEKISTGHTEATRDIASLKPPQAAHDLVQFDLYKWRAEQMIATAQNEMKEKNFEKAAQFYKTFFDQYPHEKKIDDQLMFEAGVAAYESNNHHEWTLEFLQRLIREYPASKFYRKSKLWLGLTYLKTDKKEEFVKLVDEFKKKYRNTDEWKILAPHYEEILKQNNKKI